MPPPISRTMTKRSPSLEEAAIYTTSLSHVSIKGGRFFMPFGRLDMIHDHDLPFTTRPPSLDNYIGGESQGDGVQVQALMPMDHFLQFTGGVFNKAGADFPIQPVGTRRDAEDLTYFTKALTSFDSAQDHTFEWGVSSLQVPDSNTRRSLAEYGVHVQMASPGHRTARAARLGHRADAQQSSQHNDHPARELTARSTIHVPAKGQGGQRRLHVPRILH